MLNIDTPEVRTGLPGDIRFGKGASADYGRRLEEVLSDV